MIRRSIIAAFFAIALRAAPVVAADPWPVGISAAPGMYRVAATWQGGGATVLDTDWERGVYRLNLISPPGAEVLVEVRYLPGMGYDGRLGAAL